MILALCLFLAGAVAGLFLAIRHFTKRRLPPAIAIVHGIAGASGFACLLFAVIQHPDFTPTKIAVAILIVGVAFGCVNAVYHIRGRRHRSTLIVAHALIAFSGVATLAYGIWLSLTSVATPTTPIASAAAAHDDDGGAAKTSVASVAAVTPVASVASAEPPTATADASTTTPPLLGLAFTKEKVTFDANTATLNAAALVSLSTIAKELKRTSEIQLVEIQGHADPRGDDQWNVSLTRARARAVRDTLVTLGVPAGRLRSVGYGARCPLNPACTATTCAAEIIEQERRVAFLILEANGKHFRGQVACTNARDLIPREDAPYQTSGD